MLTYGPVPRFNPQKWDFRVIGVVEEPLRFSYEQFRALPQQQTWSPDFHCVTTWSRLDNVWEGVLVADLMKMVKLKPEASYVINPLRRRLHDQPRAQRFSRMTT